MDNAEKQRLLGIITVIGMKFQKAMQMETEFVLSKEEVSDIKQLVLAQGGIDSFLPQTMNLDDFPSIIGGEPESGEPLPSSFINGMPNAVLMTRVFDIVYGDSLDKLKEKINEINKSKIHYHLEGDVQHTVRNGEPVFFVPITKFLEP